jgi:hypothetical protein
MGLDLDFRLGLVFSEGGWRAVLVANGLVLRGGFVKEASLGTEAPLCASGFPSFDFVDHGCACAGEESRWRLCRCGFSGGWVAVVKRVLTACLRQSGDAFGVAFYGTRERVPFRGG